MTFEEYYDSQIPGVKTLLGRLDVIRYVDSTGGQCSPETYVGFSHIDTAVREGLKSYYTQWRRLYPIQAHAAGSLADNSLNGYHATTTLIDDPHQTLYHKKTLLLTE